MVIEFNKFKPEIAKNVFIAPTAVIIGEVEIGEYSSIWFNSILRGDDGKIKIGKNCNIQDACVLHEGVIIEDNVTVGHRAIIHKCRIKRGAFIGIGAIILNDAVIEEEAQVAAGCLVPPGMIVKKRTLVMGIPAKEIRELTDAEVKNNLAVVEYYKFLATQYNKNKLPMNRVTR